MLDAFPYLHAIMSRMENACGAAAKAPLLQDAQLRLETMFQENGGEPEAVRRHTWGCIYPSIAMYRALTVRMPQAEALALMRDSFGSISKLAAQKLRTLLKLPGLYRLVPRFFYHAIVKEYGTAASFAYRVVEHSGKRMALDMRKCPYEEACRRYGCPELTDLFCTSDDIAYGNMHPHLKWGRTQTLGRGGSCCDFRISIQKGELS